MIMSNPAAALAQRSARTMIAQRKGFRAPSKTTLGWRPTARELRARPAPAATWKHHPGCLAPRVRTVFCKRRCRSDAGAPLEASPAAPEWHFVPLGGAPAEVAAFACGVVAPSLSAPASGGP